MSNCIIKYIHASIEHSAVIRFQKLVAEIASNVLSEVTQSKTCCFPLQEDLETLVISEEQDSARLKKLKIRAAKKELNEGVYKDCAFINLDHPKGELSRYTYFLKSTHSQKCDFVLLIKSGNRLDVAISEMKSSDKGINPRCENQFLRTKPFVEYLITVLMQDVTEKNEIFFHRAIFLPECKPNAIALVEPLTSDDNSQNQIKFRNCEGSDYLVFEVQTNAQGEAEFFARDLIQLIKNKY